MRPLTHALACLAPLTLLTLAPAQSTLKATVQPFVKKYCATCHGADEPEADLDLLTRLATPPTPDDLSLVLEIRDVLRDQDMPPEGEPHPSPQDRAAIIRWADSLLARSARTANPGRVTMRRLSRTEYRNTIRDLLHLPAATVASITANFPTDDLGYGFDNNGDALTVSALHIEKYAAAAQRFAALAISTETPGKPTRRRLEFADFLEDGSDIRAADDGAFFTTNRTLDVPVDLPRQGTYRLRLTAGADQAGPDLARLEVRLDRALIAAFDVPFARSAPDALFELAALPGGRNTLAVAFTNDYYQPADRKRGIRNVDRNLWVGSLEILGPLDEAPIPAAHRWIFANDRPGRSTHARARAILTELLRRTWRRPPTPQEVRRSRRLVRAAIADGESFPAAIQLALHAALVSPNFLFRVEPQRTDPEATPEPLGQYEIATRLSYFLWSSLPDERLLGLARNDRLDDPAALEAEVQRMLADPRARALATNFAAQWLELRSLEDLTPDPGLYPSWSAELRDAMRRETELFFYAVLQDDRDIRDLIDARDTMLNETLARHYGIPGVQGEHFRAVRLPDRRRGGLLGHASIQTVTSNPDRTSPVKRGKWVLEQLLDDAPPAPPPDANFPEGADVSTAHGLRAQLAEHRRHKTCASCHNRMDVLGLALQNYDAIGRWRDADAGQKIDASGELPGGRKIDGVQDLKDVLRDSARFRRCLAKKLFLYALGREVRGADEAALEAMVGGLPERVTLRDLILAIVRLDAFRQRGPGK